jgi:hypothetical protein
MLRQARYLPAVAFALLALAFVGLWVRSYDQYAFVSFPLDEFCFAKVSTCAGVIVFETSRHDALPSYARQWSSWSGPVELVAKIVDVRRRESPMGLGLLVRSTPAGGFAVMLPYWLLVLSYLGVATLLAFKPITRFTVRGLLITTTLLAAVLGLAVYAI